MSIHYLAWLVTEKNRLNRKRRRFYNLMNPGHESIKVHPADKRFTKSGFNSNHIYDSNYQKVEFQEEFSWFCVDRPMHKAYSKMEAEAGYKQAQSEMKAMTKHMRKVRTELGARFRWGDSGNIQAIEFEGKTYHARALVTKRCKVNNIDLEVYAGHNEIEQLAMHYIAECQLGLKVA